MIKEVKINDLESWRAKHLKSIELNYSHSPHFEEYFPALKSILTTDWEYLSRINICLIIHLKDILGIKTELIRSSSLHLDLAKTERLVEICRILNAETYLSGPGGKDYLDEDRYSEESNLLKLLLDNKNLIENVENEIDSSFFLVKEYREIYETLLEHSKTINQVSAYEMIVEPDVWARMSELVLSGPSQIELEANIHDVKLRKYQYELSKINKRIKEEGLVEELLKQKEEISNLVRKIDQGVKAKLIY